MPAPPLAAGHAAPQDQALPMAPGPNDLPGNTGSVVESPKEQGDHGQAAQAVEGNAETSGTHDEERPEPKKHDGSNPISRYYLCCGWEDGSSTIHAQS